MKRKELLVGAGSRREKMFWGPGFGPEWEDLTTLDMFEGHNPDIVWDLRIRPLPFQDSVFDAMYAWDVLEHLGQQGDFVSFFEEWSEWWRILKPGGFVCAISPHWSSPWAWGDPGHTRVYGPECLMFLDQTEYMRGVGKTPMTDYRSIYKADFEAVHLEVTDNKQFVYVMKAIKPSRGA